MFKYELLKAFRNKECTVELKNKIIKFPEIVQAGFQSKPLVIFVKNISIYELMDIALVAADSEVSLTPSSVQTLMPSSVVSVVVVWKPSITREEPLRTKINCSAKVVKRA